MDLILYGISHDTAPVDVREKFSFSEQELSELMPELYSIDGLSECLIVSTCNRTEIYAVCKDGFNPEVVAQTLFKYKNADSSDLLKHFYFLKSLDAVRHLFSVTSGLKSQVLGENQIQGQVKDSYSFAIRLKTTGPFLNKLFHMAFRVGKTVRTETNIGLGAVSISSAAAELAGYVYEELSDKSVLLIGAGETGELVARHLLNRGISTLKIANRTKANAEKLALDLNADVVDFDKIADEFFLNDIVISATSGADFLLTRNMLEHRSKKTPGKVVAIDIAVPRDIDPGVADLDNVFLYNMDDLKTVVDKNMDERRAAISPAQKIISHSAKEYEKWMKGQRVVPTIKYLQGKFEDIRLSEIEKNKHCGDCQKRRELDELTRRIIKKILMAPVTKLINDTNCSEVELQYLRKIFSGESDEK